MKTFIIDKLKIYTRLPVSQLLSFSGKIEMNKHGTCDFVFRLNNEIEMNELRAFSKESLIKIYELNREQKIESPIFCGFVYEVNLKKASGDFSVIVKTVTSSKKLDREQKMRSFQNVEMTYRDIVEKVIKDYENVQVIWGIDGNKKINRPIIQYKETDWEFIIRLTSHFNSGIFADETQEGIRLYIGIEENVSYERIEDCVYECGISSHYFENDNYRERKLKEKYVYYILKRDENRFAREGVKFFGRQLMICSKEVCFESGGLVFYYTLGTKEFLYQKTRYNRLFAGLQLEGEVRSVEKECVKIHLMIDTDEEQELFLYSWLPITGNVFYCMPEVKSKVLLQFLGEDERNAVVKNIIKTNADVCNDYLEVQNRIFETLEKKTWKFFADEMTLSGSKIGNMPEVVLKDKDGIHLNTHEKLDVQAAENIVIKAGKIRCSAPVGITQCAVQSSMEIHQDFNLYSPSGVNSVRNHLKDMDIEHEAGKRKFNGIPNWQAGYASLGAIPVFGNDMGGIRAIEMHAVAGIPVIGGGKPTVALADAVNGIFYCDNRYANAFQTIKINVMNGGYPLPKCIKSST